VLKELEKADKAEIKRLRRKVGNVGRSLAYLVARGSIEITVLKVSSLHPAEGTGTDGNRL
jgi:hypothetical protein